MHTNILCIHTNTSRKTFAKTSRPSAGAWGSEAKERCLLDSDLLALDKTDKGYNQNISTGKQGLIWKLIKMPWKMVEKCPKLFCKHSWAVNHFYCLSSLFVFILLPNACLLSTTTHKTIWQSFRPWPNSLTEKSCITFQGDKNWKTDPMR